MINVGDSVKSNVDAQGLEKGKIYQVVRENVIPAGFFTIRAVIVSDGVDEFPVYNSHLVLAKVEV